ncbi:hypothetical protein [Dysgonomonas sp. 520]|uniref:hypothetical protein n=1 Tax=Dysgonomonas sp. 520 TaxID=2302931 RepID=UPI0013D66556|nr:hypothetical protein [Dysgonomonas sp. 520]NDW10787.1 hypothetical protein [Dysgonomonas sp. 520]
MKKSIFCLFIISLVTNIQAQNDENNFIFKKFDCQNCNKGALDKCYQNYKERGFQVWVTVRGDKVDLTQKIIDDFLDKDDIKQLCIDTWYIVNKLSQNNALLTCSLQK